jgi:hypothetical protein
VYLQNNAELQITLVAQIIFVLLLCWVVSIFYIRKEYLQTLITPSRRIFTGAELFLNDSAVTTLLLQKTESRKPLEVVHSLSLLENLVIRRFTSSYTKV